MRLWMTGFKCKSYVQYGFGFYNDELLAQRTNYACAFCNVCVAVHTYHNASFVQAFRKRQNYALGHTCASADVCIRPCTHDLFVHPRKIMADDDFEFVHTSDIILPSDTAASQLPTNDTSGEASTDVVRS